MKQNMGMIDRIIRLVVAAGFVGVFALVVAGEYLVFRRGLGALRGLGLPQRFRQHGHAILCPFTPSSCARSPSAC